MLERKGATWVGRPLSRVTSLFACVSGSSFTSCRPLRRDLSRDDDKSAKERVFGTTKTHRVTVCESLERDGAMPTTSYEMKGKRVFVAGQRGMVGGALVRRLQHENCEILTAPRATLDLMDQASVRRWFTENKPHAVFLAAGVGAEPDLWNGRGTAGLVHLAATILGCAGARVL